MNNENKSEISISPEIIVIFENEEIKVIKDNDTYKIYEVSIDNFNNKYFQYYQSYPSWCLVNKLLRNIFK